MSTMRQATYRGYGIVLAASSSQSPFIAEYTVTKPIEGETGGVTHEVIHQGAVEGTFHSEQAAWDAVQAAARSYIDGLPALD